MQINNLKSKYYNMPPKLRTGLRHFALTGLTIAGIAVATKNIKEDITKYRESLNNDTIELTEQSAQKDEVISIEKPAQKKLVMPIIVLSAAILTSLIPSIKKKNN